MFFRQSVCEGSFVKKHLQNYVSSTSSPLHIYILTYTSAHLHIYIHICTSTSRLIFTSSHLHIYIHICTSTSRLIFTSSHLHLCSSSSSHIYISAHVHICTSTSLLIFTSSHHLCSSSHPHIYISHLHLSLFFTFSLKAGGGAAGPPRNATLCGDRACRMCEMQASVRFVPVAGNPLRRSCVSRARNAGESAICPGPEQPSAEIVRVEGAKCRRECDLSRSGATLCGDRACRGCQVQARVRFVPVLRNPLRRSCVSRVRSAGESAIWLCPAQSSAEIVRVEGAKCRRECELVVSGSTLCGDRACRVRFGGEQSMLAVAGDKSMQVLFHCFGGINRSAGILCAWLVVASGLEAVQLLLQRRPALRPWRNRPYMSWNRCGTWKVCARNGRETSAQHTEANSCRGSSVETVRDEPTTSSLKRRGPRLPQKGT